MKSIICILLLCLVPQLSWQNDEDDHNMDVRISSGDTVIPDIFENDAAAEDDSLLREDNVAQNATPSRTPEELLGSINLAGIICPISNYTIDNHTAENVSAVYHVFDVKSSNVTCTIHIIEVPIQNLTLLKQSDCLFGEGDKPTNVTFLNAYKNNQTGVYYDTAMLQEGGNITSGCPNAALGGAAEGENMTTANIASAEEELSEASAESAKDKAPSEME